MGENAGELRNVLCRKNLFDKSKDMKYNSKNDPGCSRIIRRSLQGRGRNKMKKWIFVACTIALVVCSCVTTPPSRAVISSAIPRVEGPESGYTGYGDPTAHDWSDDDARTLLWLRRNFPELWSDVPFPLLTFFSYNIHHDRRQYMPIEWDYYFANPRDRWLQIRMFTLEARDRNQTRRNEVLARKAAEEAAARQAVTGEVLDLSNEEVSKKLETVFP